jgi:hypothetical protein
MERCRVHSVSFRNQRSEKNKTNFCERDMTFIRVAYKTKKAGFDYVDGNLLETLISQDEASHFFRPSEKRWVSAKFDAVREGRGEGYQGLERRRNQKNIRFSDPGKNPNSNTGVHSTNWLESLWRHIETS